MPTIRTPLTLLATCLLAGALPGAVYYVDGTNGDNGNDGSEAAPLKDVSRGTAKLEAGDTLIIREGRYHDTIGGWNLKPKRKYLTFVASKCQDPENPVTIRAAEGETVVFDGTVALADISEGGWQRHGEDGIWKIQLTEDVWQLFDEGEIQTSARWPNAFWHDGSIWDQNNWASFGDETYLTNREGIDADTKPFPHCDIAKAGFDATGAMIIMNISNFDNYCEVVTEHGAGEPRFKTTFNKEGTVNALPIMRGPDKNGQMTRQFRKGEGRLLPIFNLFFLECSLALLDAPTEWYYDQDTKVLYYYPMDGADPTGRDIRGKVQDYAIDLMEVKGLRIQGLDFFGTTVRIMNRGRADVNTSHVTIEDCDFRYPSYSKRMLGNRRPTEVTRVAANQGRSLTIWNDHHYTVRNCTFTRSDGVGIFMAGGGNRLENCLFKEIDYSVVDPSSGRESGKQMTFRGNDDTVQVRQSPGIRIHRVTVDTAGSAHSIPGGANVKGHATTRGDKNAEFSFATYCRVVRGGLLQVQDGGNFHIWQFNSDYGTFDHCWASETTKWGFRFDGTYIPMPGVYEYNSRLDHCRASYCIAWDTWQDKVFTGKGFIGYGSGDFILKGDHHEIHHNVAFDGGQIDLYIRSEDGGNKNSRIYNNLATNISGKRRSPEPEPFNGDQGTNMGDEEVVDVRSMLRDPDNLDFRPRAGTPLIDAGTYIEGVTTDVVGAAPDIGAYEYGCQLYWIPGYQAPGASTPIPPHGTTTAKPDLDLIWLQGYQAKGHTVFFGASPDDLEEVGSFDMSSNICPPGRVLERGTTYYWRVDTIDRSGAELTGEVWSFTVGGATAAAAKTAEQVGDEETIQLRDAAEDAAAAIDDDE